MKKQQLVLTMNSSASLVNFLKRFAPVSNSLLLEFEDGYIKAKTHTPERSVVKSSKTSLSDVFDSTGTDGIEKTLFGVYSVDKLIKSFSHFGDSPVEFILECEKTDEGWVGISIILKNDTLEINFQCASLRLFTHITDEMMGKIADASGAENSFVMAKESQGRINSLSGIDGDQKLVTIEAKNGTAYARGKSFNLTLVPSKNDADVSISVYKSQFSFLDKEDMTVHMNEDRLIFYSLETDTQMIIGKAD